MAVKGFVRRRALIGLGVAALVVAAAVSASGPTVNQQLRQANAPDLILYNGLITTLDRNGSREGRSSPPTTRTGASRRSRTPGRRSST
jgi:hypothetical protein